MRSREDLQVMARFKQECRERVNGWDGASLRSCWDTKTQLGRIRPGATMQVHRDEDRVTLGISPWFRDGARGSRAEQGTAEGRISYNGRTHSAQTMQIPQHPCPQPSRQLVGWLQSHLRDCWILE